MAAPLAGRARAAARRAAAWLGWTLLGALALAGLALSAVALLAAAPFARGAVASRVVRVLDEAIAGSVDLAGIEVLPGGAIELKGLQILDPDGHLVLAVGRARLAADLTALRARVVGLELELEAPSVLLEDDPEGGVSLARAFAPPRRSPGPERAADGGGGADGGGWTVHVSRLVIRRGEVWWVDAAGETRLEADGLDVDARGTLGPGRTRAEVRLDGELREPVASPLFLEVVAARGADAVRVPVLRLEAGGSVVELVAEGDWSRRRGRIALTRLAVSREQARALLERAPEGSDLRAAGYAESDGEFLTASLAVEPAEADGGGGRGDAALAARLGALGRAVGFDVALDRLDPSRLAARAPQGRLTLTARGAAAGSSLDDLRARLALSASRSLLRGGEIRRAEVRLRASGGAVEVERASAAAPGLSVSGAGRWRRGGPLSGSATADAPDLAAAGRNLARLLGTAPPGIAGRARVVAELSGTAAAPALAGTVDAPALRAGGLVAEGLRVGFAGNGPLEKGQGRAEGRIVRVARVSGGDLARNASLRAALQDGVGTLSLTASVPGAGKEPLAATARGRLGPGRETVVLEQLGVAWPGSRWALARPATVELRGPSVDRLELAADSQRVALAGGLGPRGALDARAELSRLDLARLPPGVLPEADGVRGIVSASLAASGTVRRPELRGSLSVEGGAFRGLAGLTARGEGALDGARRRATLSLSAARAEGGTVDLALDVPVPLAGRGGEPLEARVRASALPLRELLHAAGREEPAAGAVALELRLHGTAGAPALAGEVTVEGGSWRDLEELGATVTLEDPGEALRLQGSGTIAGRRVLAFAADVPLDVSELVAAPGETLAELARARAEATADVTSLDLAAVAGRAGVPRGLAGALDAHLALSGSPSAPRGQATLDLAGGAWRGWRRIGASVKLAAADRGLTASGTVTAAGQDAVRFEASLAAPPERLGRRAVLLAAALRVEASVPAVSLAVAEQAAPLAGTLDGHVSVGGSLRAPRLAAELAGAAVSVQGRPLGDARATARYSAGRGEAEVVLRPAAGGTLRATLALSADLGLDAPEGALLAAPAEATAVGEGVGLGFLAAVAPTRIRSAGGRLDVDVAAKGPLGRLSPRGTLRVAGGHIAVTEFGEWTDVAVDARFTDDAFEVSRLEVRRGPGRASARASVSGLRGETARVSGKLDASGFAVTRAGMHVATVDLAAEASGTWRAGELALEVSVPNGVVRLPKKQPRTLQSLEPRKDIVVGRRPPPAARSAATAAAAPGGRAAEEPLSLRAHVVVPRNFFVKSDNPEADIELKADVRYELIGGQDYAEGSIEVVRGSVEPIAGRNFLIERGRVQFTGGPPQAALLDVEAKYQNPAAVVTVNVSGSASAPEIRLSSQPPMDEAQIAMLIATGRTELKAGSGAVGTLTGEEAGRAALGAVATRAFRNLVQDKLPLDTVALDSGTLRAGKYVTDKIYVGYVRRFDADPTKNENADEVRVEYQITPRWMFESRYGNAQSGSASLIWSRDY